MKTHGKLLLKFKEFNKALVVLKQINTICNFQNIYEHKMKLYRWIGICYQEMMDYQRALAYFTKSLQCSWLLKMQKYELLAYDHIGIQHFYLGDVEKARSYHQRMMDCQVEPVDSPLRKLGISKLLSRSKMSRVESEQIEANPLSNTRLESGFTGKGVQEILRENESEDDNDFELPVQSRNQNDKDMDSWSKQSYHLSLIHI
eukprot:TRINITY_DN12162_c0_g3_i1.p1 TRINITY_DN12162_c0_g3~~TRINITY_DN12162_c0_g3_i1.p1  ORF type:complete len:202 (+),score=23.66 TRINITY_DN12162_c0_g3_i1:2-607(+)